MVNYALYRLVHGESVSRLDEYIFILLHSKEAWPDKSTFWPKRHPPATTANHLPRSLCYSKASSPPSNSELNNPDVSCGISISPYLFRGWLRGSRGSLNGWIDWQMVLPGRVIRVRSWPLNGILGRDRVNKYFHSEWPNGMDWDICVVGGRIVLIKGRAEVYAWVNQKKNQNPPEESILSRCELRKDRKGRRKSSQVPRAGTVYLWYNLL